MSEWKNGKRSIPDHQIQALAALVGIDAADLWLIAQQARNPFRVSQSALLSVIVSAFVAAMLAGLPFEAKADQYGKKSSQTNGNGLFIVTHSTCLEPRRPGRLAAPR